MSDELPQAEMKPKTTFDKIRAKLPRLRLPHLDVYWGAGLIVAVMMTQDTGSSPVVY